MPFNLNDPGIRQSSLQVFSGLATEPVPDSLPEGVSPSCGDVEFVPGSVSSRRGLVKHFATPFPSGVTVVYGKSYVQPNGQITNLYMTSDGKLWTEAEGSGVKNILFQSTPSTYARSVTADGREYIAISDGLHGQEAPLQYDGTYLDRVTQDGPGTPPTVTSIALPSVNMAVTAPPSVLTVTEVDPSALVGLTYTQVNIFVTSLGGASPGQTITIAGNSSAGLNTTYTIIGVYGGGSSLIVASASLSHTITYGLGGTGTLGSGSTAVRAANVVTVGTATPHQLQAGYQVQIGGLTAAVVGGVISSIVVNNESAPGLATVTMSNPHGLSPNTFVTLTGINGANVGGSISNIAREGDVVTVQTASAHGLAPGAVITIAGSSASFNTTTVVANVISPTMFTLAQVDADGTGTGGTVTLNWPITDSSTPNYYKIVAAPTATTFQIALDYSDGTWSNGQVSFAWDGLFFVQGVPNATTFTYQQNGPSTATSQVGTVSPYGQAAPGTHQCRVSYLTRQGSITPPSPPVTFTANGGQYISVSNLPVGPSNVVARVLQFTGAQGAYFFYIPVEAQVNGQFVATPTQVNDNTSTSVILDFSDNTLFSATGVSIPGNNVAAQICLEGALGFGYYASRLMAFGMRNRITNLLNMGFDGGSSPSLPNYPTGWTNESNNGSIVEAHVGPGWQMSPNGGGAPVGQLVQSAYEDSYGAPILLPNTQYTFRAWISCTSTAPDVAFIAHFVSLSTSFYSAAILTGAQLFSGGIWVEADFSLKTPAVIPSDIQFEIYSQSNTTSAVVVVDEMSVIYTASPYRTGIYSSYVNNPEGIDGVTGYFGPDDTRTVMDMGIIRNVLYLFTQDPSGRLHETSDNSVTEPSGWTVDEVAANCGALSAFCLTRSQADDGTGSGGEEWLSWVSSTGPRIFGGGKPSKIAQEIQPNWSGDTNRGFQGLNFASALTIWGLNDYINRIIYFGVPSLDAGSNTVTPNQILTMNYRELDSDEAIANSPAFHNSYSGRMIATDVTRKWAPWNLAMNGAALMYQNGTLQATFFCGNGLALDEGAGFGNCYTLSGAKLTDDDYGQIYPYYFTYAFVSRDAEVALQIGSARKLLAYGSAFVKGVGTITFNYYPDSITNQWPLFSVRNLLANPKRDMEFLGGNCVGQRVFLKISSSPLPGQTDNSFNLSKLMAALKAVSHLTVAGTAEIA